MSFYTIALAGGGAIGAIVGGLAARLLGIDGLVILGLILSTSTFLTLGRVVVYEREHSPPAGSEA